LEKFTKGDGADFRLDMAPGKTVELPDGLGTVTFDGVSRYVKLQVSHTPGQKVALGGVVLALTGLLGSLFIRPRRIWVRTRREGGRTTVEVAGLDRSSGGDLTGEIDALTAALSPSRGRTRERTGPKPEGEPT
jgi:cytochrome c biogenesis protein